MSGKPFPVVMEMLIEKYSFIKGIIITDVEGAEVLKVINGKSELASTSQDGIRTDAIEMAYSNVFQSTQDQISKLEQAAFETITVVHNDLVIEQRMLGQRILLTMICDANCNYSLMSIIAEDIKSNFKLLDILIEKVQKQTH